MRKNTNITKSEITIHELSYNLIPDVVEISFDFQLVFDGFVSDYKYNIEGLKASTIKDGTYPIIICTCERIGCGGIYISTHIQEDVIIWEKFWDGQSCGLTDDEEELYDFDLIAPFDDKKEHKSILTPLRFNFREYSKLADELVKESIKIYKNEKQFQDTLEEFLAGDVFIP